MATVKNLALAAEIFAELDRANAKYESRFNSLNEALGTIYAEYSELAITIIHHEAAPRIREEAIQVAAMAIKLIQYLEGNNNAAKS